MKVTAFLASPHEVGHAGTILDLFRVEVERCGHEFELVPLYGLNFKGCSTCGACSAHVVEYCRIQDGLAPVLPLVAGSDLLIFSAPFYFGYLSGTAKTFLDRWCTFVNRDFSVRRIAGKKLILLLTCGAPREHNQAVIGDLERWFTGFFKLELVETIVIDRLVGETVATGQQTVELDRETWRARVSALLGSLG